MTIPGYIREAWGHVMEGPEMVEICGRVGIGANGLASLTGVTEVLAEWWMTGATAIPSAVAAALRLMDREVVPDLVFVPLDSDVGRTGGWFVAETLEHRFTYSGLTGRVSYCKVSDGFQYLGEVPTLPLARDLCRGYLLGLKEGMMQRPRA